MHVSSPREARQGRVLGEVDPAAGRRRRGHLAPVLVTRQITVGPCPPPCFAGPLRRERQNLGTCTLDLDTLDLATASSPPPRSVDSLA